MYYSNKENVVTTDFYPKKQVRFNSSSASSPSDAQVPRPLSEIQNAKKLDLFSQFNDESASKCTESFKKPFINDDMYCPPKLFDANVQNNEMNFGTIPKPCSDLELSVFESSSFVDSMDPSERPRCIKDMTMNRNALENDSPYPFSPTRMPLTNPFKYRTDFLTTIPKDLLTSASQSRKEFHNDKPTEDSALDFFTRPFVTNKTGENNERFDTKKSAATLKHDDVASKMRNNETKAINSSATQCGTSQNFKNGTRNHNYRNVRSCHRNNEEQCDKLVGNRFCVASCCTSNVVCDDCECYDDRHCKKTRGRHYVNPKSKCKSDIANRHNTCCVNDDDKIDEPLDAVEAKRNAIQKKYQRENDRTTVAVKNECNEPTVSDLYQIIQLQNKQLMMLQKRFDRFLIEKETNSNGFENRTASVNQIDRNDGNYHRADNQMNNLNCVEHISIGVMTSFEMVMSSSNYLNNRNNSKNIMSENDVKRVEEGVQTTCLKYITPPELSKNGSEALNKNADSLENPQLEILKCDDGSKRPERNFLDGITRVNNVPSPTSKRLDNKGLDRIVEENQNNERQRIVFQHNDDVMSPCETRRRNDCVNNVMTGKDENNGWTFYNNVVDRVNNLLNSPPNANVVDSKAKHMTTTTPSHPEQMVREHDGDNVERHNIPDVHIQNRSPVNAQPRIFETTAHPIEIDLNKPLSDLSLHMKELASKYNVPAPPVLVGHNTTAATTENRINNNNAHNVFNGRQCDGYYYRQLADSGNVIHANKNVFNTNNVRRRDDVDRYVGMQGQRLCVFTSEDQQQQQYNTPDRRYEIQNRRGYEGGRLQQQQRQHHYADNMYGGVATDVSFATMQYMQRYQLLTVTNEQLPSPMIGAAPLPPVYKAPSRILDITTLKQQPKLL